MTDTGPTREEIKAQLEAVEARTDAKFERIMREIERSNAELGTKVDVASAKNLDKWTAIGIAIGSVALIYAMLAYGGDLFGLGLSAGDVADRAAKAAVAAMKAGG